MSTLTAPARRHLDAPARDGGDRAHGTAAGRSTGTVRWFSHKGFGFIDGGADGDVYVHHSGIRGVGFPTLDDGDRVEYTLHHSARGPEAVDVVSVEG